MSGIYRVLTMQGATQNLESSTFCRQGCNVVMEFGKAVSAMLSLFRGVACWEKMSKKPTVWV